MPEKPSQDPAPTIDQASPLAPTSVDPDRQLGEIGSRVVYEDDRVRVWFLKLAPGERSPVHRHVHDHLLIQIAGDRVAVIPEADTMSEFSGYFEAAVQPGQVTAIPAGGIETAYNPGQERYHEVIVELKQPSDHVPPPTGITK